MVNYASFSQPNRRGFRGSLANSNIRVTRTFYAVPSRSNNVESPAGPEPRGVWRGIAPLEITFPPQDFTDVDDETLTFPTLIDGYSIHL